MRKKRIRFGIWLAVLLAAAGACVWYLTDVYRADEAAVAAMASAAGVTVEREGNTTAFIPEEPETGLIFYPGGKVEYAAYAPLMRALAERNVLCVLVEMPLNLAVLNPNAAEGVPERYPQVERWYIGGHSLGGSMAASHAAANSSAYEGLVLLAAYSTADLTASDLAVVSILGSEDGVLNREKYEKYKRNLPASMEEHLIAGGCHAGFGSYGAQDGDGAALITGDEQIAQTVLLLMDFFGASGA